MDDGSEAGLQGRQDEVILGLAGVHRVVVLLGGGELVGVLGAVEDGGVGGVHPLAVLVPGDGGEGPLPAWTAATLEAFTCVRVQPLGIEESWAVGIDTEHSKGRFRSQLGTVRRMEGSP